MPRLKRIPSGLTIGGSDSGGGAGVQADLKTFAAIGVHGLSALTCVTAQNPEAVLGVEAMTTAMLRLQLEAIGDGFKPGAIKTGMLYSRALIEVTAEFVATQRKTPLVVDPVMIATSGARLLNPSALAALTRVLLPLATILTPNVPEAEALTGHPITTIEDQRRAARELVEQYNCAVVVKGGHVKGAEAADIFFDGVNELLLSAPFLRGIKTHGTGCTFSAAIAAHLARGRTLATAVVSAKKFITRAIAGSRAAGRYTVLWPA
jgi:hydroxymethylpyrimidine kinase/phosphomethylpyrimidine kinase